MGIIAVACPFRFCVLWLGRRKQKTQYSKTYKILHRKKNPKRGVSTQIKRTPSKGRVYL